ncbi:MAG: metal-sensitive transcriptional regulator [Candidatus Harrisonbacteria bacterium]|nr:metal-sensitive transcriptional regulator [Candidatus Harrisonbacteria bacterium]
MTIIKRQNISIIKSRTLKSVKQAQGTLCKVSEMTKMDRYCPEIIQQIDSVIGLLRAAKRELLSSHLNTCVAHQMLTDKQKAVGELMKLYNLSN